MRIIVTGGAGFVGTHLTRLLLNLRHDVMVIDNLFNGKMEHVHKGIQFRNIDLGVASEREIFDAVREFQPTDVVHLAAIHFIPYCMDHPSETFASNVRSTEVMLRAIEGTPVRKFVTASTVDVYPPLDQVHHETDPTGPCNVYGLSKLLTENLVEYATRVNSQVAGASLRFSNIYGPNETNPHFIPRVLELLQSDTTEFRMGYLGGSRDFIHVTDVAKAIAAVLFNATGEYNVFNVGTGTPTTVRTVLEIIKAKSLDDRPIIEDKARFRPFDRVSLTPAVEKIHAHTGWLPEVSLENGLSELVSKSMPAIV